MMKLSEGIHSELVVALDFIKLNEVLLFTLGKKLTSGLELLPQTIVISN